MCVHCTCIYHIHIHIYHIIYIYVWEFEFMQIFVCVYMCTSHCLCVFLCVLQAVNNVCVGEKEEAEERCKSETASKQPAVASVSVSLPASTAFFLYFSFLHLNKHTR